MNKWQRFYVGVGALSSKVTMPKLWFFESLHAWRTPKNVCVGGYLRAMGNIKKHKVFMRFFCINGLIFLKNTTYHCMWIFRMFINNPCWNSLVVYILLFSIALIYSVFCLDPLFRYTCIWKWLVRFAWVCLCIHIFRRQLKIQFWPIFSQISDNQVIIYFS